MNRIIGNYINYIPNLDCAPLKTKIQQQTYYNWIDSISKNTWNSSSCLPEIYDHAVIYTNIQLLQRWPLVLISSRQNAPFEWRSTYRYLCIGPIDKTISSRKTIFYVLSQKLEMFGTVIENPIDNSLIGKMNKTTRFLASNNLKQGHKEIFIRCIEFVFVYRITFKTNKNTFSMETIRETKCYF